MIQTMKSVRLSLSALALGFFVLPLAHAQSQKGRSEEGRSRGSPAQSQGRGQVMNPEARVEQLDRELNLTADQKKKITAIYAKTQEEMRGMARGGGDQQANREKLQELMRSSREQVRAVLTDEQKKKFDAMPQGRGGDDQRGRGQEGRGAKKR
jgi:periplasmic protein CpxP/Spy